MTPQGTSSPGEDTRSPDTTASGGGSEASAGVLARQPPTAHLDMCRVCVILMLGIEVASTSGVI